MRLQKLLGTFLVAAVIFAGCSNDSDKHKHSWSTEYASDATTHWIKCSGCTEIKDKSVHTWNHEDYQYDSESAKEIRTCTECSYVDDQEHQHETTAALSKDGTNHWKVCDVCGGNYEVTAHTWNHEDYQYDSESGKEIRTCTECSYVDDQEHQHETTAALSKDGTNHWKVCDVCGGNYEVTSHTEDTGTVTTAPTCVTKGVRTYKCAVCEEVLRTEEIEVIAHTEDTGTVTTAPTCVTKGVRTFKCAVCEEMLRTEEIEVTAHTDDAGTVSNEPTCLTKGVMTYNCAVCKAYLRTEEIPELYSSPVDAETGLAATSSSTYIYFGVFPKTVLPANSTVRINENVSVTMGANTYYKGNDGNYYAKVKENSYLSSSYTYTDGTTVQQSKADSNRYFKVEPVKWKVLTNNYNDTGKALLLAEDSLTANVPYYVSSYCRTISNKTVYPNNYKYSTIRAYLNGKYESDDTQAKNAYVNTGFLQTAFTATAQALISDTEVDNSEESTGYKSNPYVCENTTDKIFLLSRSEVINSDYGFDVDYIDDNARIRVTTDFALANHAGSGLTAGDGCEWRLRSPYCTYYSYSGYSTCVVRVSGSAEQYLNVDYTSQGVVPALSISLQ